VKVVEGGKRGFVPLGVCLHKLRWLRNPVTMPLGEELTHGSALTANFIAHKKRLV